MVQGLPHLLIVLDRYFSQWFDQLSYAMIQFIDSKLTHLYGTINNFIGLTVSLYCSFVFVAALFLSLILIFAYVGVNLCFKHSLLK